MKFLFKLPSEEDKTAIVKILETKGYNVEGACQQKVDDFPIVLVEWSENPLKCIVKFKMKRPSGETPISCEIYDVPAFDRVIPAVEKMKKIKIGSGDRFVFLKGSLKDCVFMICSCTDTLAVMTCVVSNGRAQLGDRINNFRIVRDISDLTEEEFKSLMSGLPSANYDDLSYISRTKDADLIPVSSLWNMRPPKPLFVF